MTEPTAPPTEPLCGFVERPPEQMRERGSVRRTPRTGGWLRALAALGTDARKPFLEEAPLLIAISAQTYGVNADGSRFSHYYVPEAVGIKKPLHEICAWL